MRTVPIWDRNLLGDGPREKQSGHDATIIYFDGRWIAQWDDGYETATQVIWQCTSSSPDLSSWNETAPIEAYTDQYHTSTKGCDNPIAKTDDVIYQPSLVVVKGADGKDELWSFFKGKAGLYWSTLKTGQTLWHTTLLYGPGGQHSYPNGYHIFPGNNGVVLSTGRVVVPVTLEGTGTFPNQITRDSMIFKDKNFDWVCPLGVSYPDDTTGTQCWESTIWEPSPNILNLISRNNRSYPAPDTRTYDPRENLKTTTNTDQVGGWAPEKLLGSLTTAMSRPHAIRNGARNILAQNDWYKNTRALGDNRRNISLFFSRGDRPDTFVAGLNFATGDWPAGQTANDVPQSYPQIGVHNDTAAVIYTRDRIMANDGTGVIRVASITPLPDDSTYYIFPRQGYRDATLGHNPVEGVLQGSAITGARFKDAWGSAGIDLDASNSSSDNLYVSFVVTPETRDRECIFTTNSGVKLFSDNGTLKIKKWNGGIEEKPCGTVNWNAATKVDFVSGNGVSMARTNGGAFTTLSFSQFPWQPYFGDNAYDALTSAGQPVQPAAAALAESFLIDLASVGTQVGPINDKFTNYVSSGSTPLVPLNNWKLAAGMFPSPLVSTSAIPPEGGQCLEEGANGNTLAQRDGGFVMGLSNVFTLSFDFYVGGGTTIFGLQNPASASQGPAIGYSGGLYFTQATASGLTNTFATTTPTGSTHVLLSSYTWYRISSTFDFGKKTATLASQKWNGTSWDPPQSVSFNGSPTAALTMDQSALTSLCVRMANGGSSRMTNLKCEPVCSGQ